MLTRTVTFPALFVGLVLICGTLFHFWISFYDFNIVLKDSPKGEMFFSPPLTGVNQSDPTATLPSPQMHSEGSLPLLYPAVPPQLTIIAIWNPGPNPPIYLPNFFASVAANPSIDLLFIKYDKHQLESECQRPFAPHVHNVREVCLTFEEYWSLHADFLCERWGGCTGSERNDVTNMLHQRAGGDRVNSYFRPFRPAVFSKWINPKTKIWGWCDMDTFFGNFEHNFPWDEAQNFDFLFPSPPIDGGDDILLFFPGHLAFFKNSPHVIDEFMNFPNVKTMDAFLNKEWVTPDTEECEYSHFALTQTKLTWLRFPGIVHSRFHLSSSSAGVYAIADDGLWNRSSLTSQPDNIAMRSVISASLQQHKDTWSGHSTFSPVGQEYIVHLREGEWPWFLWFPKEYAIDFIADGTKMRQFPYRRYTMRREPNGPVYDRTEPYGPVFVLPPDGYTLYEKRLPQPPMVAYEMLYNHFQIEKFADWWSLPGLPPRPVSKGEVLLVDRTNGAQVWNSAGEITFDAGLSGAQPLP